MAIQKQTQTEVSILELEQGEMEFCILGTTPLIMNRMSQKAWRELLAPKGRKNAAEKASSLKHDPVKEFRDSPYVLQDPDAPALLGVLATAFKGAMGTAAMDMPGVAKTQIKRMVYVEGELLPVFGIPKLFMAITRSSDMNRTPDVRTRAILPEWACKVKVRFTKPQLREQGIANLLAAAGFTSGVGDWRQEKGSGTYGSFKLVSADNPDFKRITETQGRFAQELALDIPEPYDLETAEMLEWFSVESKARGFKPTGAKEVEPA